MEAYNDRMRLLNQEPCNVHGKYVLYWCQSAIRSSYNQGQMAQGATGGMYRYKDASAMVIGSSNSSYNLSTF
uniref:Uncharacterized protein n=1 Tax=Romanomermis culicivorax TaxID=13658 RepID=A0A915IC26_ROMCU